MKEPSLFRKLLSRQRPILSDGAMGTLLHKHGAGFEICFDELNLSNPAIVAEIHREYIEAGSNVIQTNTFGANRYKLSRHNLEDKVKEINKAGVDLARKVISASFKNVLIAGDVGPLGVRLAPFGRVQLDEARQAFTEQVAVLIETGVDVILIETISDLYEMLEAIRSVKAIDPDIPIIASMTYTRDDSTVLGDTPVKVAQTLFAEGVDIIGANCSGGPNQLLRILTKMRNAVPQATFSIMPNAGWPEEVGGRIMYPAAPEYFGKYALTLWEAGASILGGCCGTTPEHIASISKEIASFPDRSPVTETPVSPAEPKESVASQEISTDLATKLSEGKFVVTVEMSPPKGLSLHKLLAGASLLADSGTDAINVADSPMARMRMSPWAVCNLIQKEINTETILHFPTRGRSLLRVQGDLLAAHALGIRNVFVVMGDPTSIGDYPEAMDNFDLVPSGLIKLIKQGFNEGVDHAGTDIGQPTSFYIGCALNIDPPEPETEIKNLYRKIKAGADFILTQPIFNPEKIITFKKLYQEKHGEIPLPIIIGLLPLASSRHATFLQNEVPGITIPPEIMSRMEQTQHEGWRTGIDIAKDLVQQIKPLAQGVYIMPAFNRFDYAAEIVDSIKIPDLSE